MKTIMIKFIKKKIKLSIIFAISLFSILLILIYLYNLNKNIISNKFNYESAKNYTTNFLKNNKQELEKIAKKIYIEKPTKFIDKPYKKVSTASYHNYDEIGIFEKDSYIKFDIDSQSMLGGQYYGLIYSYNNDIYNTNIFIYDENKETNEGNNIFIREKISNNWYFYYDDYDGKLDIKSIK